MLAEESKNFLDGRKQRAKLLGTTTEGTMIVLETFVVDTDSGCGGSLRVVILDEETNETRTVYLDLSELYSNGISGGKARGVAEALPMWPPTRCCVVLVPA